jgi:hypothetical protein
VREDTCNEVRVIEFELCYLLKPPLVHYLNGARYLSTSKSQYTW